MTTDLAFGSKTPTVTMCWPAIDKAGELLVERVSDLTEGLETI
jgi:hypothetical protein